MKTVDTEGIYAMGIKPMITPNQNFLLHFTHNKVYLEMNPETNSGLLLQVQQPKGHTNHHPTHVPSKPRQVV